MVFFSSPELFVPAPMLNPARGFCQRRPSNNRRRRCHFQPLDALDDSFFTMSPTAGMLWPAITALDDLIAVCAIPSKTHRIDKNIPSDSFHADVGGLHGFNPENVAISTDLANQTVTVTAEEKSNGSHRLVRQTLALPQGCDTRKLEASLNPKRGILSLRAPPAGASPDKAIRKEDVDKVQSSIDENSARKMAKEMPQKPVILNNLDTLKDAQLDEATMNNQDEPAKAQSTSAESPRKTTIVLGDIAQAMKHVMVNVVNKEEEVKTDEVTNGNQTKAPNASSNDTEESNKNTTEAVAKLREMVSEVMKHVQINVLDEKEANKGKVIKDNEEDATNQHSVTNTEDETLTSKPTDDNFSTKPQEGSVTEKEDKEPYSIEVDVTGFDVNDEVTTKVDDATGCVRVICEHVEVAEDGAVSRRSLTKEVPVDATRFDLSTARVEPVNENHIAVVVNIKKEEEEHDVTWTPILVAAED